MKILQRSIATSASATSQNASFPASNVLEMPKKKRWQAASSTVSTATLSLVVQGEMDTVAIFGIASDTISISISDPNETGWEAGTDWESGTEWASAPDFVPQSTVLEPLAGTNVASTDALTSSAWFEFARMSGSFLINVAVANTTGRELTLSIGTVIPGERTEGFNAKYGIFVDAIDHSIEREMAGGNIYYKPRDLVREFSFTLMIIEQSIYDTLWNIIRQWRRVPMAMLIIDDYGSQWLVMGRIKSMRGAVESYAYTPIDMVVREEA